MFEFFFKYPIPVFTKGRLVLLGSWPGWLLPVLIVASVVGLGWLIRSRLSEAAPIMHTWRAGMIWLLQSLLVTLVLILLWQPAITVAELKSQQNMIAVLVDDSRSMAIADSGDDGKISREGCGDTIVECGDSCRFAEALPDSSVSAGWRNWASREGRRPAADGDGNPHQRWVETAGCGDSRPSGGSGGFAKRRRRERGRSGSRDDQRVAEPSLAGPYVGVWKRTDETRC